MVHSAPNVHHVYKSFTSLNQLHLTLSKYLTRSGRLNPSADTFEVRIRLPTLTLAKSRHKAEPILKTYEPVVYRRHTLHCCGPRSSVGIVTDYGLDDPGSNTGGGRDFPPVQTGHGTHSVSCEMGIGSFPEVKCGRGVLLTTHPLLVTRSWKSRAIPLPTLRTTPGL